MSRCRPQALRGQAATANHGEVENGSAPDDDEACVDGAAEDSKAEDSKAEDGKAEDSKTEDSKTEDSKAEDSKAEDSAAENKAEICRSKGKGLSRSSDVLHFPCVHRSVSEQPAYRQALLRHLSEIHAVQGLRLRLACARASCGSLAPSFEGVSFVFFNIFLQTCAFDGEREREREVASISRPAART